MLKRSHRDLDLPSLAPPQFIGVSEAKKLPSTKPPPKVPRTTASMHSMPEHPRAAWDAALLNAYIVEAEVPRGPTAGLGMGFEVVQKEPKWSGSWSSHGDYMQFLFGNGEKKVPVVGVDSGGSEATKPCGNVVSTDNEAPARKRQRCDQQNGDAMHIEPTTSPQYQSSEATTNEPYGDDVDVIDADADEWITTDKAITVGAREFAAKTKLRRGFFAKALKRQLEDLRDENDRLKRVAAQVLDDHERLTLFSDLGTESVSSIVGEKLAVCKTETRKSGLFHEFSKLLQSETMTRPVSARTLAPAQDENFTIIDDENTAKAREALDQVVEKTNRVVSQVDRRDLSLVKVVQQAQRAFVITNPALPDNPIVWSSDEFSRLTGYARHEICGRNCRFLQGPLTNPKSVEAVRTAIDEKHEASVILLNYRKDGSTFWNRFFIAPLRDSKGKVVFYVGVQTDVSQTVAINYPDHFDDNDTVGTGLKDAARTLIQGQFL